MEMKCLIIIGTGGKLEILKAVVPPGLHPGKFSPPDALIASMKPR
jgi:hypothetical protein